MLVLRGSYRTLSQNSLCRLFSPYKMVLCRLFSQYNMLARDPTPQRRPHNMILLRSHLGIFKQCGCSDPPPRTTICNPNKAINQSINQSINQAIKQSSNTSQKKQNRQANKTRTNKRNKQTSTHDFHLLKFFFSPGDFSNLSSGV